MWFGKLSWARRTYVKSKVTVSLVGKLDLRESVAGEEWVRGGEMEEFIVQSLGDNECNGTEEGRGEVGGRVVEGEVGGVVGGGREEMR